ncbi:hypothetical protein F4804DRAFT_321825 [Jackrogersella minutella]|nr:hypothetical protein F4804DRAFT_321825 [Jackrogersella minutella]
MRGISPRAARFISCPLSPPRKLSFPNQNTRGYSIMASSDPFSTLLSQDTLTARLAVLQPAADKNAPIELKLTDAVLKETSYECISYDRSSETSSALHNTITVSVDGSD